MYFVVIFFMIVEGELLIVVGIYYGVLLVIDCSLLVKYGDIVVVIIGGEFSIKCFYLWFIFCFEVFNVGILVLILCEGDEDLVIFGVIIFCINKLR